MVLGWILLATIATGVLSVLAAALSLAIARRTHGEIAQKLCESDTRKLRFSPG